MMNIGILGTGIVGQTIAAKVSSLGHQVMIGTRDVASTLASTEPGIYGTPPFAAWQQANPQVRLGSYAQAAAFGEVLFNCTSGTGSLSALEQAGAANLGSKILIDIANPLDFSHGMPPSLTVCNTDSLAEQIQTAYPSLKVVKTLNTLNASLMVNPSLLPGDHDVFVSGDDAAAKAEVTRILADWFGWQSIIDLGDISTARATEMLLPIWVRLYGVFQTPVFNFRIVR